jgi:hypothetical protein
MTKLAKSLIQRHALPAAIALILLFVAVNFGELMHRQWNASTPAIEWHGVEVITKIVKPGEILVIEYSATVNKQCPSDLRSFIIAEDGSAPVRFPITIGGFSRPSSEKIKIKVSVIIPPVSDPGLAPYKSGIHFYRTAATRYCPDGIEEDSTIPDAPFYLKATGVR